MSISTTVDPAESQDGSNRELDFTFSKTAFQAQFFVLISNLLFI
jgi:hypothetical protein